MYWLINSSIGRKFIMSISGIFLVLFLLFHMTMNLTLLLPDDGKVYDMICEFLGANWYAIAGTLVLVAGMAVHFVYATILTLQNRKARGFDNYSSSNKTKTEWSAKNLYVLGVIIVLGLIIHLWNFWYRMQYAELVGDPDAVKEGSELVKEIFASLPFAAVYLVWLAALWLHLTHGIWSAFQTLGLSGKIWYPRLKMISNIVSTLIAIGFASIPVYFVAAHFLCNK